MNPVRNSSRVSNPAGIILGPNPAAEQRGIISNGVKEITFYPNLFLEEYSYRKNIPPTPASGKTPLISAHYFHSLNLAPPLLLILSRVSVFP